MEKRKWLWKRKSSERSPGETDSSGSISSHSERFSDDQDPSKASPTDSAQSPEVTSKTITTDEDVNDKMKSLTDKLSAALVNVSAKDDLVKQHVKVAEEAVAGWEKAENEVTALKKQLEVAIQQKAGLEDRVSHLDGALKECVRQLRQGREELEEKIHEAVVQKSLEWESIKSELENQFIELKTKEAAAKSESPAPIVDELCQKLEYLEQENATLKLELLSQSEELEIRTIERDLSTQAAEAASKQHLESIKKVAKLEAECRRLKAAACKPSSVNDHKTSAASSIYVESLPDSQSDSGEKLNAVELDARKVSCSEPYKSEQSCLDSWASTLISELNQFKNEKSINRNLPASSVEIDLMDDFLEMEQLAALSENETGTDNSKAEAVIKQSVDAESSLRAELEVMAKRTADLEEKLQKVEGEKLELEETLQKVEGEKFELEEKLERIKAEMDGLEMALNESQDRNEASQLQLSEAQHKLLELQEELLLTNESKQQIEFQLVSMEAEARTMSAKVNSIQGEIEKERVLSAEIALKYHELEEELSRKKQEEELQQNVSSSGEPKIKQEDFDVAANKLAECQKTIASLGNQLKSLATLKDFLIDTASIPEFSAGGSATPKETINEGDSPPSVSSSTSSAVSSNHTMESTFLHVANHGRPAEIARSTNLLSTNKTDFPLSLSISLGFVCRVTNAMTAFATAAALSLPNSLFRSSKLNCKKGVRGGFGVFAVLGEEGGLLDKKSTWGPLFDVEDPRSKMPQFKGKFVDFYQALEVARYDIQYCDWRARQDLLTIMILHEKVVEVLNPLARDYKSIGTMKKELAELQDELAQAHRQVHISEARVATALDKLAYMEELVNDRLLQDRNQAEPDQESPSPSTSTQSLDTVKRKSPQKNLNVSGPVQPYHPRLKNFWYPVAFSTDLKDDTMVPIDCFEESWVLFRGKDGKPGCLRNTCAHRACPLHLGSVNEGRIQCPYHGWEYSTDGKCEKMPSTRLLDVKVKSLPCFEQEGMIWIWPGSDPPAASLPSLQPPPGFQVHAEIVMELPVEHGLLLDNLLDLAHAPFTHTSTFAKGWTVPSLVKFLTPASGLQGYWDPYPIDMEFRPPCMVLSTIGISKPGKLEGQSTRECATHLHQLHVCLPSSRQKTRLLYRMSLDFAAVLKHIPFMHYLWRHFAEQVLNEDLRLVLGQQERMINGANVWNWPVSYDKLGVRYRLWRDAVERGAKQLPFEKSTVARNSAETVN
ncbi:hypothetical protein NC651_005642 [Populus alba x Populus x berolinensis]|nr:hypothetical protein NC651_005642 [Populus alba x Populus x berolinensis]